jgi:hypothetical protein
LHEINAKPVPAGRDSLCSGGIGRSQTSGFGVFRNDTGAAPASFDVISSSESLNGTFDRTQASIFAQCLRILDLALKSRDFTADSEIPNVFAIWATEACS